MPSSLRRRLCAGLSALAAALATGVLAAPAEAAPYRPRADSLEWRRSWGLEAIGARAAYEAGLSGRGVTVALVDCGVRGASRDVARRLSRRSTDVVADRVTPAPDLHATYVAAPINAARDGRGMLGVAYNATLLSLRADFMGFEGGCAFRSADLARALDLAVSEGARVIVLPLQSNRRLAPEFEAALERTVRSGAAVVIAAGNHKAAEPSWPARYAVDPRFEGSIVVAGATSYQGAITPWTNRAGEARRWYVAAPGEWVLTNCRQKCRLVSGTSFSTSYVAGALALVMEAEPRASGREAVARILGAARDEGAPGVDDVYGRGVLDLRRAFPKASETAD